MERTATDNAKICSIIFYQNVMKSPAVSIGWAMQIKEEISEFEDDDMIKVHQL